jgi:hypothetical protein
MSGRSLHLREGKLITNRKTDRRQSPTQPLKERLHDLALTGTADTGNRVRMVFVLPKALEPFVSRGALDGGVEVLGRGFVRISNWSADKCFGRAQTFFRDVAKDRPGFTLQAVIINAERPDERYTRHLTVVRGALVISTGVHEPRVFEAA